MQIFKKDGSTTMCLHCEGITGLTRTGLSQIFRKRFSMLNLWVRKGPLSCHGQSHLDFQEGLSVSILFFVKKFWSCQMLECRKCAKSVSIHDTLLR